MKQTQTHKEKEIKHPGSKKAQTTFITNYFKKLKGGWGYKGALAILGKELPFCHHLVSHTAG